MSIQSLIHRDQHYVHTCCTGKISMLELLEYQEDIWRNGDVSGFDELFDATQADFSAINLPDIFQLSQNALDIDTRQTSSKLALIIAPGVQEKLADFYRSTQEINSSSSRNIQFFYSTNDALNWILDETLPLSAHTDTKDAALHYR
jgi:hypothetical protein